MPLVEVVAPVVSPTAVALTDEAEAALPPAPTPATDSGTLATAAPADSADTRYTQPETPFALASTDDVGLLSFNWLVDQAQAGAVLPRRQELPPEAFADVDALRAMHAAAPAHVAAAVLPCSPCRTAGWRPATRMERASS